MFSYDIYNRRCPQHGSLANADDCPDCADIQMARSGIGGYYTRNYDLPKSKVSNPHLLPVGGKVLIDGRPLSKLTEKKRVLDEFRIYIRSLEYIADKEKDIARPEAKKMLQHRLDLLQEVHDMLKNSDKETKDDLIKVAIGKYNEIKEGVPANLDFKNEEHIKAFMLSTALSDVLLTIQLNV